MANIYVSTEPDESGVINGCNGDNTQHIRSIFNLRHISN